MVYLFGGAFLLGASNDVAILGDSLYDGKEMADRGGVIVVTVNYRVGTLGFLSTGDARLAGLFLVVPGQVEANLLIGSLTCQVTTASGISTQPFPGCAGTSGRLAETLTTSPSLANRPEPLASATRCEPLPEHG